MHTASDHTSEMDTKEWKLGIGHWIDEVSNQVSTLWFQFIVFAPKRNNSSIRFRSGQSSNPITMQAGAIDYQTSGDISARRFQYGFTSFNSYTIYFGT